jgi:hypothetical protein
MCHQLQGDKTLMRFFGNPTGLAAKKDGKKKDAQKLPIKGNL